jgi:hypothetical protein
MAKHSSARAQSTPKPPPTDEDGNQIHNEILLELSSDDLVPLLSKMEFVRLKAHHLLHETGDTLKSAYFCNTGMVSILSVFPASAQPPIGRWLRLKPPHSA